MIMKFNKILGLFMLSLFGTSFGMEWMPEDLRLNASSLKNEKKLVAQNKKVLVPLVSEAIKVKSPKVMQGNSSNSTVELLQQLPTLQLDSLDINEEKRQDFASGEERLQALCDVFDVLKYEKLITTEEYDFLNKDLKKNRNTVVALDSTLESQGVDIYVYPKFWGLVTLRSSSIKAFSPQTEKVVEIFDNKKSKMAQSIKAIVSGLKKYKGSLNHISSKNMIEMCGIQKITPRNPEETDSGFLGLLFENDTPEYDYVAQRIRDMLSWLIDHEHLGSIDKHYFSDNQHVKALIEYIIDGQNKISFFDRVVAYAKRNDQGLLQEREQQYFSTAIGGLCAIIEEFTAQQLDYTYVYTEELEFIMTCVGHLKQMSILDSKFDQYLADFGFVSAFVSDVVDNFQLPLFQKCHELLEIFDHRDWTKDEKDQFKLTCLKIISYLKDFIEKKSK